MPGENTIELTVISQLILSLPPSSSGCSPVVCLAHLAWKQTSTWKHSDIKTHSSWHLWPWALHWKSVHALPLASAAGILHEHSQQCPLQWLVRSQGKKLWVLKMSLYIMFTTPPWVFPKQKENFFPHACPFSSSPFPFSLFEEIPSQVCIPCHNR